MKLRLGRFVLAATVALFAALAVQLLTGWGGTFMTESIFGDYVYDTVVFLAALACALRAWAVREERWAWLAFAIAIACWGTGDVYYSVAFAYSSNVPFPSVADGFYLAFYVPAYVGVLLLVRSRIGRFTAGQWLDGGIAALALAGVAALMLPRIEAATGGSAAAIATNLAYPVGDAALLAVAAGAAAARGRLPGRSWLPLIAGLMVFAIADTVYLYKVAADTYHYGTVLDLGWVGGMVLVAVAAWQRSKAQARADSDAHASILISACFATVALTLLTYDHFRTIGDVALALESVAIALAIARLLLTYRDHVRLLRITHAEALTDALTQLGNRRRLLLDLDEAVSSGESYVLGILDLDGFKAYNDTFGHLAGDALLQRFAAKLAEIPNARSYRLGGDEFCVLARASATRALDLISAATAALVVEGDGFAVAASHGAVLIPEDAATTEEALRLADQRMYEQKTGRAPIGREARLALLASMAEFDQGLAGHATHVGALAIAVGRRLGFNEDELWNLRIAADLHDIGKIAIPDDILYKPGSLDDEEWSFIRRHTLIGERIVGSTLALRKVATLIRSAHERWDGRGYPDGLVGEAIPLASRIIFACDAYDAMTRDRPYRTALTQEQALEELSRGAGTQFDPRIVRALRETLIAGMTPSGQADWTTHTA